MDYELISDEINKSGVAYPDLCFNAYDNAIQKSIYKKDYWFCIWLEDCWFIMNCNSSTPSSEIIQNVTDIFPRTEVYLDLRYLFGLIIRKFHWSIAEIGSQLKMRRFPDIYDEEVQNFLNYFHI